MRWNLPGESDTAEADPRMLYLLHSSSGQQCLRKFSWTFSCKPRAEKFCSSMCLWLPGIQRKETSFCGPHQSAQVKLAELCWTILGVYVCWEKLTQRIWTYALTGCHTGDLSESFTAALHYPGKPTECSFLISEPLKMTQHTALYLKAFN